MKMIKKGFVLFLCIIMILSVIPMNAIAIENEDQNKKTEVAVESSNSLGDILENVIENSEYQKEEDNRHICDIDITNNKANIQYVTETDCNVVIGLYDETTDQAILTSVESVSANMDFVTVDLPKQAPEHYVIKAALIDDDFSPISSEYINDDNTQWHEDFLNLKTTDFDQSLVLNLDNNIDKNFLVFKESVVFIDDEEICIVESNSEDIQEYRFGYNETLLQQLSVGKVFCYNKENINDMLIGTITNVELSAKYIKVTSKKVFLEDAFQIVKIEYNSEDSSNIEDDVVCAQSDLFSTTLSYKKNLMEFSSKIKGSLTGSLKISLKIEFSLPKRYLDVTLSLTPSISFSVTFSVDYLDREWFITGASVPVGVTGLSIDYKLYFYIKGSVSGSFNATWQKTFKWSFSTSYGCRDLSSAASFTGDVKLEASIEFGIKPYLSISLIKVVNIGYSNSIGIKISASQKFSIWNTGESRHNCTFCVDGDVYFVWGHSARLEAFLGLVKKELPLPGSVKIKLCDFYWSISHGDAGFGECPHKDYLIKLIAVDEDGNAIPGAAIDGIIANSSGSINKFYSVGSNKIVMGAKGYKTYIFKFDVTDRSKTIRIKMYKGAESDVVEIKDSSYGEYEKYSRSKKYAGSGLTNRYVAPLTYTEPVEGVYLSTALSGQRRSDVAWVQRELKNLGYDITADGYYGNLTANVVMQFQRDYDLPVTGAVNSNVVAVIKKPIKPVTSPTLRLTTATNIPSGGIATVSWDGIANAEDYNIYVYNNKNELVNSAVNTKSTTASFVLYNAGEYTIKAISENERFTSLTSELNTKVVVHNPCLVKFVDYDGEVLCQQFVEYGKSAVAPAAPERDGYTFSKWDKVFTNLTTEELTVNALYAPNQYTVKFLNTDGTELMNSKYYYGESASAPDASLLNIQSGYAFVGWDKDFSNVTSDITIKPVIEWINDDLPIIIDNYNIAKDNGYGYSITATVRNFNKKRTNGRIVVALKTQSGRFITMTESSAFTLAKSASEQLEVFVPCKENAYYVDIFVVEAYEELIPISETVRYTIGESNNNSGLVRDPIEGTVDASFAGKQAILFIYKVDDAADYTNEFIGQTVIDSDGSYHFDYRLREEPTINTGDFSIVMGIEGANGVIHLGTIDAPKPTYTVRIVDFDDSIIDTQTIIEGNSAILPAEIPERAGYTFAGWDYSNTSIHENLVIHAIYVPKTYSVIFIDWTNERFDTQTYYYGEPLRTPELNALADYDTIGWDCEYEGMPVTENMVVTAKYEKKSFDVKFYDYDGNLISQQTVTYGEEAELPDLREDELHNFYGWDEDSLSYVQSSLSVHPYFTYKTTSEAPIADKESGVYSNTITVALSSSTENSELYYSINGSDYVLYSSPFTIASTSEIRAYTSAFGKNDSDEAYYYFVINKAGNSGNWKYPVNVYDNTTLVTTVLLNAADRINSDILSIEKNGYAVEGLYFDSGFSSKIPETYTLNAAVDVYVNYQPSQYTVTFVYEDENGAASSLQTVNYLEAAVAPEPLAQIGDTVFVGWDTSDYLCVTGDLAVHPVYVDIDSLDSIKLNRSSYTMLEDFTYTLTATTTGEDVYEIFWESSDETIATVDKNGRVTAINEGLVVITATILGKGVSDTCFINVERNPELSLVLSPNAECEIVDNYICGISPSSNSVLDLRNQIQSDNVKFYNGSTELRINDNVCTGTIVKMYDSDNNIIDTLTIVVIGDVDGDGEVNNRDSSHISRYLVGKETLAGEYLLAADVNADGFVNNRDASMVSRYLVGKESI